MSRHRNTFVSGGVRCVAVIYGSTYVCNMKGHSSHSCSVWQENAGRRISMRHSGNTSRRTSPCGTLSTSASRSEDPQVWHQDAPTPPSGTLPRVNKDVEAGEKDLKLSNEGVHHALWVNLRREKAQVKDYKRAEMPPSRH